MTDEEFDRLVDELNDNIVSNADEEQAQALIERFVEAVDELRPSTATCIVALAALVRGALPLDRPLRVTLTAFVRAASSCDLVCHPDGSPVYHGETRSVLQ